MIDVAKTTRNLLLSRTAVTGIVGDSVYIFPLADKITRNWEQPEDVDPTVLIVTRRGDEYSLEAPMVTTEVELQCIHTSADNASALAAAIYDDLNVLYGFADGDFLVRQAWFDEPAVNDQDPVTKWAFTRLQMNLIILECG